MRLRNTKQIRYYPVGLITMLFIPLSYFLAAYKNTASNERLLSCPLIPHVFCGPAGSDWILDKVYTTIELTGDETKNEKAILKGKLLVWALVQSQSTTKGVRFKLCDEMEFETLIELLNTLKLGGAKIYVLNEENIWVMNPSIRKVEVSKYPIIYL